MPARPTWEGHLRLSLVSCPVTLHKAVGEAPEAVHFHLLNPETHNRVKQKWCDPEIRKLIERRDLVRGFEVEKGEYIIVSDDELKGIKLESTKVIDIERFVDAAEIDRLYWDQPYYMVPSGKTAAEPFAVIREAMSGQNRIGLGKVVMASRERQVAIEVRRNGMLVSTLRSHDEVRSDSEILDTVPEARVTPQMVEIARQIIAQTAGPFDPEDFRDRYEDAVRELVQAKGGTKAPKRRAEEPEESNVVDLMEALKRSLKGQPPRVVPAKTPEKHVAKAPAKSAAKAPARVAAAARKPATKAEPKPAPAKRRKAG
ncbi:non-homologous end joining protein Ku [Roseomonas sp. WA12]